MSTQDTKDGVECEAEWKPPRLGHGSAPRDFLGCLEMAKEDGWRTFKVKSKSGKDDWQHRCPDCVEAVHR
jgi:hypothetical protein